MLLRLSEDRGREELSGRVSGESREGDGGEGGRVSALSDGVNSLSDLCEMSRSGGGCAGCYKVSKRRGQQGGSS